MGSNMNKFITLVGIILAIVVLFVYLQDSKKDQRQRPRYISTLDSLSYVHTGKGYTTRLLPKPAADEGEEYLRIPSDTKLKVLDRRIVQMGQIHGYRFLVEFNGQKGWISQFCTKERENISGIIIYN
jgi:hypothetical protein